MIVTSIVALLSLLRSTSAVVCYTPDGANRNAQFNVSDGALYAPCDYNAEFSMCCSIGPDRGDPDVCVNGLCQNGDQLWRESCTDPTWNSPSCYKLFINGTGRAGSGPAIYEDGYIVTDVLLTACDDGSYCYGENNRACCKAGGGVWLVNGTQYATDPNVTSSSSTSAVSTNTSPASTSSTPAGTSQSGQTGQRHANSGIGAGGIAGVVIGVLVVLAAVVVIVLLRRRSRRGTRLPVNSPGLSGPSGHSPYKHDAAELLGQNPVEMSSPYPQKHGEYTDIPKTTRQPVELM